MRSSSTIPSDPGKLTAGASAAVITSLPLAQTLIKRLDGSRWNALVKPGKRLAVGDVVRFGSEAGVFPRTARRHGGSQGGGR